MVSAVGRCSEDNQIGLCHRVPVGTTFDVSVGQGRPYEVPSEPEISKMGRNSKCQGPKTHRSRRVQ